VKVKIEEEEKLKGEAQAKAEKRKDKLHKSIETLLGKILRHLCFFPFSHIVVTYCLYFYPLLGATDTSVDRSNILRVDSMADVISFTTDSSEQVQVLLKKTNVALSRLHALIFPKLSQEKTVGEMVEAFYIDTNDTIEVLQRNSWLYGALLSFQLLMGYGVEANLMESSKALPKDNDGSSVDLGTFTKSARSVHTS
jgi:hypothetical protein